MPIFMTSHDISVGTVREVPKYILQLDFELPFVADLVRLGLQLSLDRNISISKNAVKKIAEESNSDIRYLINTVNNFLYRDKKITVKNTGDQIKDFRLDTFNGLKYCGNSENWKTKSRHASSYTNSAVFHNYPKLTDNSGRIPDLIATAEELRNFAYSNQMWDSFERQYCVLGTVIPMSIIGDKFSIDVLSYPPSPVSFNNEITFEKLQQDSIIMIFTIIPKFFILSKKVIFKGDLELFQNDLMVHDIYDPIKACKLGLINRTKKERESYLKEIRKVLKKIRNAATLHSA